MLASGRRTGKNIRVKCQACGRVRKGAKEHVIPRWARDALADPGDVQNLTANRREEGTTTVVHERPSLNITLDGKICQKCNDESLANLEQLVEPILKPMAADCTATLIGTAGQRLLSTWAVKTLFLIELAMRQRDAGVRPIEGFIPSKPELAWVWTESHPPPRSRLAGLLRSARDHQDDVRAVGRSTFHCGWNTGRRWTIHEFLSWVCGVPSVLYQLRRGRRKRGDGVPSSYPSGARGVCPHSDLASSLKGIAMATAGVWSSRLEQTGYLGWLPSHIGMSATAPTP